VQSNSSREAILQRIRSQSGREGLTSTAEREAVKARIQSRPTAPLPSIAKQEPVAHFIAECERVKTTVALVATDAEIPIAVAKYIAEEALLEVPRAPCDPEQVNTGIAGWSAYANLDWQAAGLNYKSGPATAQDLIGFTDCFCAIGESGTLLLLSSPTTPKLNALLPETHICVVKKSRIVPTMEAAFALMRKEIGAPPRATFFVSGPSRTADIEQTIVIGAHGPYRVHVLLVG
jgi:L-lactate dehydrogenase complex protein LldG